MSTVLGSRHPAESWVGITLAVASLLIMPLLAWGKLRAAGHIGSKALRAEAKETLACAYLSFALLAGLAANATLGWWWADPAAAVIMVPWLAREGFEALGEESCARWRRRVLPARASIRARDLARSWQDGAQDAEFQTDRRRGQHHQTRVAICCDEGAVGVARSVGPC